MEKQELKVSYENSGVKTLKTCGVFFFIIGVIAFFAAIVGGFLYLGDAESTVLAGRYLIIASLPAGLILFFAGAVCIGLSSIAKTALYKRAVFEQQYDFK
jgi:hypothetical protein